MANSLYTKYVNVRNGAGTYTIPDLDTDTIKGVLCTAVYTASVGSDTYLSDVTAGARAATATISTITVAGRAVTVSGTITYSSVPAGVAITQLVIYKHTGTDSTAPLIAYFDTFTSGMPVTPDGADITVTFNASGIWSE